MCLSVTGLPWGARQSVPRTVITQDQVPTADVPYMIQLITATLALTECTQVCMPKQDSNPERPRRRRTNPFVCMQDLWDKTVSRLSSAATTVAERRMAVVRNDEYVTSSKEC